MDHAVRSLAVFALCVATTGSETVYEKTAAFSKFRSLLDVDVTSMFNLQNCDVTVFAPKDEAFKKFSGEQSRNLPSYHVVEGAHLFPIFNRWSLMSVQKENPPVWVSEHDLSVYVNNALVLTEQFSFTSVNKENRSQILYAIDEVLDPMVKNCPNPTAFDLLSQTSLWTSSYTIESFLADVIQNRLEDFFGSNGRYTFFLPVDNNNTNVKLNIHAIKAHVVPNRVLFTRPTDKANRLGKTGLWRYWFPTLASGDYIKVFVSMNTENGTHLVRGDMTANDFGSKTGAAVAEIVLANVPLQNGVAHLISKPLTVFPQVRKSNLEIIDKFSSDPNLNTSYHLGVSSGFNENFNLPAKLTFFVPSNAAWENLDDKFDLRDILRPNRVHLARSILERHLVVGEIPVTLETLQKVTAKTCVKLPTPSGRVCLRAEKVGADYEVIWGEVRAAVVRANFECVDGMVHIISAPFMDDDDFEEYKDRKSINFVKIWKRLQGIL